MCHILQAKAKMRQRVEKINLRAHFFKFIVLTVLWIPTAMKYEIMTIAR